jgi:hypothetical protein
MNVAQRIVGPTASVLRCARHAMAPRLASKRRLALLATLGVCCAPALAAPAAHAYTYDYNMFISWTNQNWNSRYVGHNYHYIRMTTESAFPYLCVKLTRTSNGANYGDVYCNYWGTGHHYAGDTGTFSHGKQSNSSIDRNYPYHEEW